MATSLLAHLYSHIKGSQEDVATLSLQYILSQSIALNHEFTRLLGQALHGNIDSALNYVCQSVGENLERPDIAGIDVNGREQILCEAKFYAGLTENQPNGYLDRLQREDAFGLVFICPSVRKVTLWGKLLDLCKGRTVEDVDSFCVIVDGVRMTILSWGDILEALRHAASSNAVGTLPDIYQLEGFCRLMDDDAFIPFSTEDYGPENAVCEERHYQVLDAVASHLLADKSLHASTKGLKATAYRHGYVRYIRVLDYALSIYYDRRLWRDSASEETPFWVTINDSEWEQGPALQQVFNSFPELKRSTLLGKMSLALTAPTNASLDEVADDLKKQILKYISVIKGNSRE